MDGQTAVQPASGLGRWLSLGPARPWRELWALDRQARWVAAAQTRAGQLALVTGFALLAQLTGVSLIYVGAAAAFACLPAWRGGIVLAFAVLALARQSDKWLTMLGPAFPMFPVGRPAVWALLAGHLGLAWLALRYTRGHPHWWLARRPVLGQLGIATGLALLASWPGLGDAMRWLLWMSLSMVGTFTWFLAYGLQDQRSRSAGPLSVQMGLAYPFWQAGLAWLAPTPMGKGAAFLRKHQAQNKEDLAVTQLKGLKLLAWAGVLMLLSRGLQALVARLGIAPLDQAFAAFAQGQPWSVTGHWASLAQAAAGGLLFLAILGHKVIALARLAGFRLPRNTWRPLQAYTLAEFWNRYYYYFKELLVDFFFFPTFLKALRRHPRLRVFFATFMAAGVGNALYHFLRDIHLVATLGWHDATLGYAGNLLYCVLLALGIGVSQTRLSAGRQLGDGWAARAWSLLCVWWFVVVLQVFAHEDRKVALADRLSFFLSLFGVVL